MFLPSFFKRGAGGEYKNTAPSILNLSHQLQTYAMGDASPELIYQHRKSIRCGSADATQYVSCNFVITLKGKNAVLIIEFGAMKHKEGMSPFDVALAAAKLRLKPILLTFLLS
jgi:hypothetical protein